MEFWGVEVPAGKPTTCSPGYGMYLHVSQAALGESKDKSGKGNARVVLKVQANDSEVLLGTLSEGKCDQMPLDLVFDRDFTVSHNGTSASVYLCGYRTEGPDEEDSDDEELEEEEEEEEAPLPVAVPIASNGAAAGKQTKAGKNEKVEVAAKSPAKKADKAQTISNSVVKVEKKSVKKQVLESSSDEEDDSDEEDGGLGHPFVSDFASESDDEFDAGDSDEDMDEDDDDDDEDDEDESDESEEELKIEAPKQSGKKRAAAELIKSTEKKSKTDASSKPGQSPGTGKKGKAGPVTPVGKAAAPAEVKTPTDKGSKPAKAPKGTPTAPPTTPVSEKKIGQHKCSGCDRTFTTESALSQHAAAKHK